jgi:pSer/pThr/pTyr-binding forkhead associated (FHA) protein
MGPVLRVGGIAHPLYRPVTIVGRRGSDWRLAPDIDLGPGDRRRSVSRRHAQLTCDGDGVYLRDLGSHNGSALNGERLPASAVVRLRDGDRLRFGAVEAEFATGASWPEGLTALWNPEPGAVDAEPPAAVTLAGPRGTLPRARSRPPWWRRLLH